MPPKKGGGAGSLVGHLFTNYPGQQQVDLKVKVDVPGSWFAAGAAGGLTSGEKNERYEDIAVEFQEKHVFPPLPGGRKAATGPAIRFLCHSDAADDPDHNGFWMELTRWNRYRHDTYKERPEAEVRRPSRP